MNVDLERCLLPGGIGIFAIIPPDMRIQGPGLRFTMSWVQVYSLEVLGRREEVKEETWSREKIGETRVAWDAQSCGESIKLWESSWGRCLVCVQLP